MLSKFFFRQKNWYFGNSRSVGEGEDVFLLAIRDIAQANGGMSVLAKDTKLNRENLYYLLSKEGNPRLSSITTILDNLGIEVKFAKKAA